MAALRHPGHDVAYVREGKRGASDAAVLKLAERDRRVLVTYDLDFGEMAVRRGLSNFGVVVLRLEPLSLSGRIQRTVEAFKVLAKPPPGILLVVEPARTRSRHK